MQKNKRNNCRRSLVFASLLPLAAFSTSLLAHETSWNDPKFAEAKDQDGAIIPNSVFKIEGTLWAAYERTDHNPAGIPDDNSTGKYTGFRFGRTYLTARGDVKEGEHKGWGFRVTLDSDPKTTKTTFLKFAYVTAPLPLKGLSLRIGQQHTPSTDAQSGRSAESFWGHRYLDEDGRTPWDEFRLASSTDLGVSLLYKQKYFHGQVLLANGEGFSKTNAQSISTSPSAIASGSGDSHGLDLYGNMAIMPLGSDGPLILAISFPFRLHNVVGVERDEYERTSSMDLTTGAFEYVKGERRAKQDVSYGTEVDLEFKSGAFRFTVGGGAAVRIDRRSNVLIIDENIGTLDLNTAAGAQSFFGNNYIRAADSKGLARYVFGHVRYGWIGFVGRYAVGTGSGSLNDTLGTSNGVSAEERQFLDDLGDDGIANGSLTLADLRSLDRGQAQFHKIVLAVEFFPNERFRVAVGFSQITAIGNNGEEIRTTALDRLPDEVLDGTGTYESGYTPNYLANQIALSNGADAITAAAVKDTDLFGKQDRRRQIFIRTQYMF